jgi:hypothetical protein
MQICKNVKLSVLVKDNRPATIVRFVSSPCQAYSTKASLFCGDSLTHTSRIPLYDVG